MIIANGVPKSGTTLLVQYLSACGVEIEPGGLIAEDGDLVMKGGKPWGPVRPLDEVLAHHDDDRVIGAHVRAGIDLEPHKVAFIIRNPRNVLISWARWLEVRRDWTDSGEPSRGAVMKRLRDRGNVAFLINRLNRFDGWQDKAAVTVRFVDFHERPADTAFLISDSLGIDAVDPAKVLGDAAPWITKDYRGTWSGANSDWADFWTDDLDRLWRRLGGVEVERLYGYRLS